MSTGTTGTHAALENPWPGLAPYTEQQHESFFGREAETEELLRLIQRETLTVLFGRSGSGKSSLLHAGVIPQLRSGMYFPVLLRLNFADPDADPVEQVKAITLAAARAGGLDVDSRITEGVTPTLWDFFHQTDFWGPRNDRLTPLLIFDQFEEAFTIGKDQRRASGFLEQLADLAENRVPLSVEQRVKQSGERITIDTANPTYKIVLSLREDFVSRLDQLRPILPAIMRSRMALLPLDGGRALQVILNSGRRWVSEAVAQEIVAALAGEPGAAGSAVGQAEIEPAYLSVMCHELFRRMVESGDDSITSELVAKEHGEILEGMYERSLEGLSEPVRLFVEDRLLTASGFRGTVPLKEALAEGVSLPDLETLVDRRLLRFEDRLGTRHVELSHDLLTGVVKKSRALRAARAAHDEEERKQRELRRALSRARRRTIIALATAVLALAGVAYSAYYWLAYIRSTSSYYRNFSDQLGKVTPYGELNLDAVHHRSLSYKVIREGFRGQILSLEAVDNRGNPTIQNGLSTALNFDSSSDQAAAQRYCCLEFEYDKEGRLVSETAWNQNHVMVWGEMYVPSQGQTDSDQAFNDIHFGPDGLPKPERTGSRAEIIQVEHHAQNHETWKYRAWDGKLVPATDNAYGSERVFDAQGRDIKETSLDALGRPMNDSAGNASLDAQYDGAGNFVASEASDALGRPTLLNDSGYWTIKEQRDQWGRLTEESYLDVDGSPVVDKTVGAYIIRCKYDDRGNKLEGSYFDFQGNPMDKTVAPNYQRVVMEYNDANQMVRETFFDHAGKPVAGFEGQYDIHVKYDSLGDITEIGYFDAKGQPALNTPDNVHFKRRNYDSSGQELEESYYGLDSKPVNNKDGDHALKFTYDENGLINWLGFTDVDGNPPKNFDFYQVQYLHDQTGNITEKINTKTPNSKSPYVIERMTYDEFSNPLKTCFFSADTSPAATSSGVSCIVDVYDDRGLKTRETYLDKAGKPMASRAGIARSEYSYNEKRQMTREAYFGLSGPAKGPQGKPPLTETQYDTAGHVIQIKETDLLGNVTIKQFDAHGKQTRESQQAAPKLKAKAKLQPRPQVQP
jgi:hypothetical protein